MSKVIVTLKIMPESPETDLDSLENSAKDAVEKFGGGQEMKVERKPVAFGLQSLNITFIMDESKGDTESLEKEISEISGVNSVEVTDVRRPIG